MKKKITVSGLLLILVTLASCQEGLSISSSVEPGSNYLDISSISSVESSSVSSSSINPGYSPIDPSNSEANIFAKDITYSLNLNKTNEKTAQELVANDIAKYPEAQSLGKVTSITSIKEEVHVLENRSSATYSLKDRVREKHTTIKIDSNLKWSYRKSREDTVTSYFVEDDLVRHIITEQLSYVKDNCFYRIYAEKSYYEGMENKGTYEAYYYKIDNYDGKSYEGNFNIDLKEYTYFNSEQDFAKIDKTVFNNYRNSSAFYEAKDYSLLDRDTNYDYYSSTTKGCFGCIAKDSGVYHLDDLTDYPSMEKNSLGIICYEQDYLLNISNYFNYEEDYLTKSISKKYNDKIIRNETIDGRKKVTEECEAFYPDLSKFEEREYTTPSTK